MQKKLIALAVAGLVSGGAFAQSNVTISGQMKLGLEAVSAGGAATGVNATSRTRVTSNTSNVIFKGEENLGNGMKALFLIDSEVMADSAGGAAAVAGNGGGTFGSRQAYVGIGGGFGTVVMGRLDAHYTNMASIDAAGFNDLALNTNSINLLGRVGGGATFGGRLDNTIAYLSPNFSGFSGKLAWSALSENTNATLGAKDSGWNLGLTYANGPINVAYSYLDVNNAGAAGVVAAGTAVLTNINGASNGQSVTVATLGNAAAQGTDGKSNRLGFAYTFPMGLKVGLIWDSSKATAQATGLEAKQNAWTLPISYTAGANSFYFTYGRTNDLSGSAVPAGADTSTKMTMLAYSYAMSKRTAVNVSWVRLSNDSAVATDFWTRQVGGGYGAGGDPTSLTLGVRHSF